MVHFSMEETLAGMKSERPSSPDLSRMKAEEALSSSAPKTDKSMFRSLCIDKRSKTPYSDATQVRKDNIMRKRNIVRGPRYFVIGSRLMTVLIQNTPMSFPPNKRRKRYIFVTNCFILISAGLVKTPFALRSCHFIDQGINQ